MIARLLLQLRARDRLDEAEEAALRDAACEERSYPPDKVIIREDEELNVSTLLLDGLMGRYKDLRDGRRQISALHIGGDFVDLHSFTLKRLDHNILTLAPCRVALVPHDRLAAITEQHPHLGRLLWLSTNIDAAIHREWELSLGRRTALSRTAHLLCELLIRLEVVGLADRGSYDLSLTQLELAECVGLTPVHVNRTLRALRERGLADFRRGRVVIHDADGLARLAEFKPNYLYFDRRAR